MDFQDHAHSQSAGMTAAFKKCIFLRPTRRTLPPLIYLLLVFIRNADVEHFLTQMEPAVTEADADSDLAGGRRRRVSW